MTLDGLTWQELEPYLRKARGQSHISIINHRSRFRVLQEWFTGKEFTSQNLSIFLSEAEAGNKSASYQNNVLKLVKHIAHYLRIPDEFEGFRYVAENHSAPEDVLTPIQISELAAVNIPYIRFQNRAKKMPVLIQFLGTVGSRIDETLHLEWRDIVSGTYSMIHFRQEITKTKRERYCPIPIWLKEMILSLPRENQYIFSKLEATNIREDLEKRRVACKIPFKVTCHTFRDSSINNKLEVGIPIEQVSAYHGHIKIDTTYRYYIRIKAQQLATSLIDNDPAFKQDQTYDTTSDSIRRKVESLINPQICSYKIETALNENNKRTLIMEVVER